ncbi:polysaccharide biosynthesis protein [Sphingomonas oleivorans]|uniref:polysaccharide biosynthesis protein n=1 Tax=Sphingomonas oleivorans TaxID=1735121 RepID=UPI001FAFA4A8|nr:polysaccharide biosynthesis protein [Sphingomonas oleivorans]
MTGRGAIGESAESVATRRRAVKGAGSVLAARLGAVIEVVAQPAYTWMFGLPTYGLYMVLWSLVNLIENILDLGMTSGLQRVLPQAANARARAAAVRGAFILGVLPNLIAALLASLLAHRVAPLLNVAASDLPRLETAIRLFAWALPLWATIEIATSALRALHAFGPEIRLRLLWEQIARLIVAGGLWAAGVDTLGLLVAHLASLAITAALSLRLLGRFIDLREVMGVRLDRPAYADLFWSGISVLPANILARIFSDLPTIIANMLAPGAAGAAAAGLYAIARKVASIPQIVRQTMGYVLAPIASAAARGERETIQALYGFSVRISMLLATPTAAALVAGGAALLATFAHGSEAALPIMAILTAARAIEATLGPATAIQQVIGRRSLPMLNSAIALAASAATLLLTKDILAVTGIALSVAVGQISVAALSVAQLRAQEGLFAFQAPFTRSFLVALASCAAFALLALATTSLPRWIEGLVMLAAWPIILWISARLGLAPQDKAALGKSARKLRLGPA